MLVCLFHQLHGEFHPRWAPLTVFNSPEQLLPCPLMRRTWFENNRSSSKHNQITTVRYLHPYAIYKCGLCRWGGCSVAWSFHKTPFPFSHIATGELILPCLLLSFRVVSNFESFFSPLLFLIYCYLY